MNSIVSSKKSIFLPYLIIGLLTLCLRLYFIQYFPYLFDWDEQFHALVSKNLLQDFSEPKLFINPVLPYDYTTWCCNEIWLHKQPLFMWLSAISMKLFGPSVIAFRLPNAVLGAFAAMAMFRIAQILNPSKVFGYFLVGFYAFNAYNLGLLAGYIGMDQNDSTFTAFITLGIWSLLEWYKSEFKLKHLVLLAVFCSAAILTKWLSALILVGGFGLLCLFHLKSYWKKFIVQLLILGGLICICVLPWQVYIHSTFPIEAAYEMEYNSRHFYEVLEDHKEGYSFYFKKIKQYFNYLWIVIIPGILLLTRVSKEKEIQIAILVIGIVYFSFFTIAATKLASYIFPIYSIFCIYIASTFFWCYQKLSYKHLNIAIVLFFAWYNIQNIGKVVTSLDSKTNNSRIEFYKKAQSVPDSLVQNYTLFNMGEWRHISFMFYRGGTAYANWPSEQEYDSLTKANTKMAFIIGLVNYPYPTYIDTSLANIIEYRIEE